MAGPLFAIAGVLLLSGASKLLAPEAAASVLRSFGVSRPATQVGLVRGIGIGEMALGAATIVFGGVVAAAAVSAIFGCFALVSEILRRRPDEVRSCGCFGANDTPPSAIHTAVNVVASVLGLGAVIWPVSDLATVLAGQPAFGVAFVGLVVVACYLFFLAFTVLPSVFVASAPSAPDVPLFGVRR